VATGGPPRGAHPRVLLATAVQVHGQPAVIDWCVRLIRGRELDTDPDLAWLGGTEDWAPYWRRVWGARGLLYVWAEGATDAVATALGDEHWRVREMACRVAARHRLSVLTGEIAGLTDDPNDRVRTAAQRALRRLG
jgi:hypothetical protein